jgi:isopentenyl diphosphate isomerase/L-lactate dehydrogenase-like FMN-dependent dehydrogenase
LSFLKGGRELTAANVCSRSAASRTSVAEIAAAIAAHRPSWNDVAWARARWDPPLIVKGIMTPHDARRAVELGADAIVVSNHGGRALDGVPASLEALPAIAGCIGDDVTVLLDGGVRRGGDVVRALALGARAVLIGRPYVWGLAVNGVAGVTEVLDGIRRGMERALVALGCPSASTVGAAQIVLRRAGNEIAWEGR